MENKTLSVVLDEIEKGFKEETGQNKITIYLRPLLEFIGYLGVATKQDVALDDRQALFLRDLIIRLVTEEGENSLIGAMEVATWINSLR